jgi:type I restriction-modification system DNA methylase subunit
MSDEYDLSGQIEQYKKLVERYELLNAEIQLLITTAKENNPDKELSPEDMKRYREIARERDEAFSEMRALQRLLMDDTSGEFTATEEE